MTFVIANGLVWPAIRPASAAGAIRLTEDERTELSQYAADTWRSIERLALPSGLPADSLTRDGSGWRGPALQTSPTNIGAYLWSVLAAEKLKLITPDESRARLERTLKTLARMEREHGFFLNELDPRDGRSLKAWPVDSSPCRPHVSSVDNGWLAAALTMVSGAHPELRDHCDKILEAMDFRFFYSGYDPSDPVSHPGQIRVGYRPDEREFYGHYGMLNSEARITSYLGISRGQLPREHYFRLYRTFPEPLGAQLQKPQGSVREYSGVPVFEGTYSYRGTRIVPTWGGSMFEALMVTLFVPEDEWGPRSWGRNHPQYVRAHIQHGIEDAGYGFWGFSPAASPRGGYQNYGVKDLGTTTEAYLSYELGGPTLRTLTRNMPNRFNHGVITPHASFLALRYAPHEALENLRKLQTHYPVYSDLGFLDSVDVSAGVVCGSILAVDQGMIMAAIANALADNAMQHAFSDGMVEQTVRPLIAMEEFGSVPASRLPVALHRLRLELPGWRPIPLGAPD
jgi:hypothetical protein